MMETPEHSDNSLDNKYKWQTLWNWAKHSGFVGLLVFAGLILIGIGWFAYKTPDPSQRMNILVVGILGVTTFVVTVINAVSTARMTDIMERQESDIEKQRIAAEEQTKTSNKQWQAMVDGLTETRNLVTQGYELVDSAKRQAKAAEQALKDTESILQQDRDVFFLGNRAYLGSNGAFIEIEGGSDANITNPDLPDDRPFRLVVGIYNKGNTPAMDVAHVFRMGIISEPVFEEPPPFEPVSQSRAVPHILQNEEPRYFRGTWMDFTAIPAGFSRSPLAAVKAGDAQLIFSCKFEFGTLGQHDEFIIHFVWLPKDRYFAMRRDYPSIYADDATFRIDDRSTRQEDQ